MATPTSRHRQIALGTKLGPDALLVASASISEKLGRLFSIDLELYSTDAQISFDDLIGESATLRLEQGQGKTRYFNGVFSRFVQTRIEGRSARYRATLVPWLWLLSRRADCRIFQNKTVPAIIETVFKAQDFSDYRLALSAAYRTWEYCVQYRETDFNFVSRLLEQEGIYYFFEHKDGKHTLVLADTPAAHVTVSDYERLLFRPSHEQGSGQEAVQEWLVEQALVPGIYTHTDFDFKKPRNNLRSNATLPLGHAQGQYEVFDYPGEFDEPGEGREQARVRIEELHAGREVFRGRTNARGLFAGARFTLEQHPRDDCNRAFLVTEASYHLTGETAEAGGVGSGDFFSASLTAIDARRPFRAARVTAKPIVQGPQTAIVVGRAGEEIDTDEHGRVKVQFPWDRYGQADEKSSCWIRVAQQWAGAKWGAMYIPRIGQEVIVEFLEGDPDCPIITGRVYNGEAKPPYDLPAEKTKSTLKSNSSKGGGGFNEIRFEDKKGEEQIFIHGQRDLDVRVRNDIRETNYGNRDIRVGWEKDGESGGNLNTFVRKDVNTHIEGGQFEQVDKQLNQTVAHDVVEDYRKNQTTLVKDKYQLNAKEIVVEGGQVISQKSGKITIQGAQGVHIKGATVAIEGSTGVSLKVGGNFVSVTPAGVAVQGTMVMINSGGSALAVEGSKAVEAPDIKTPFEARRADDGKTGAVTDADATRANLSKSQLTPQAAPPYLPPSEAKELKRIETPPTPPLPASAATCNLTSISAECSHRKPSLRCVAENGCLEVVPDTTLGSDTITLKAKAKLPCGGHPQWLITDEPLKTGPSQTFKATASTNSKLWIPRFSPRVYHVSSRACNGADLALNVAVYPPTQLSIEIDAKKFFEKFPNLADRISSIFSLLLGRFHFDLPQGEFSAEACWKEHTDHRAYYYYSVTADFPCLFSVKAPYTLGPDKISQLAGRIPFIGDHIETFIESLVRIGVTATLEGKSGLSLSWERKGPDSAPLHQGMGAGLTGEIAISLSIGTKILGGDVVRLELKGESVVFAGEATPFGDEEGLGVEFRAKHKGLTVSVTFELLWGVVAFNDSAVLIAESEEPYVGPSKLYLLDNPR